jgi:hypothetical protein
VGTPEERLANYFSALFVYFGESERPFLLYEFAVIRKKMSTGYGEAALTTGRSLNE